MIGLSPEFRHFFIYHDAIENAQHPEHPPTFFSSLHILTFIYSSSGGASVDK